MAVDAEHPTKFMTPILFLIAIVLCGLSSLCLWAERKSRKWYQDRALIWFSGVFFGLSIVATGAGIALL